MERNQFTVDFPEPVNVHRVSFHVALLRFELRRHKARILSPLDRPDSPIGALEKQSIAPVIYLLNAGVHILGNY